MKKILIIILFLLFLLLPMGCSWCEDKRVVVKPSKVDVTSSEFAKVLAVFIKQQYETDMSIDEIARWMQAEIVSKKDKMSEE